MRHLLSQHKDACKTKDCRSCSITMDFAAEWDIKHRGKALKERFGYTKGVWLLHSINFPVTPQKRNSAEGANFPFFFSFFHFVLFCLFFLFFPFHSNCEPQLYKEKEMWYLSVCQSVWQSSIQNAFVGE